MNEELVQDVQRGAALLDKQFPGWENRVDLGELTFPDTERCVLGQQFGTVQAGYTAVGVPDDVEVDGAYRDGGCHYGFNSDSGDSWASYRDAWEKEILKRRVS